VPTPPTRFVTADASPLIGLATAGALELLRALYGTVTITQIVKDEITGRAHLPGAAEVVAAMRAGWIRVAPAPLDTWRFTAIDSGEASTIALARERANALLLMDDVQGREQAAALGLEVSGLVDVVLAAKRARLVDEVRPIFDRLERRGFTIPDPALRAALREAGEPVPSDSEPP
jgi:predicted nucleic acid-binding protein